MGAIASHTEQRSSSRTERPTPNDSGTARAARPRRNSLPAGKLSSALPQDKKRRASGGASILAAAADNTPKLLPNFELHVCDSRLEVSVFGLENTSFVRSATRSATRSAVVVRPNTTHDVQGGLSRPITSGVGLGFANFTRPRGGSFGSNSAVSLPDETEMSLRSDAESSSRLSGEPSDAAAAAGVTGGQAPKPLGRQVGQSTRRRSFSLGEIYEGLTYEVVGPYAAKALLHKLGCQTRGECTPPFPVQKAYFMPVPSGAKWVTFLKPLEELQHRSRELLVQEKRSDAWLKLLLFGGFAYLDSDSKMLRTVVLDPVIVNLKAQRKSKASIERLETWHRNLDRNSTSSPHARSRASSGDRELREGSVREVCEDCERARADGDAAAAAAAATAADAAAAAAAASADDAAAQPPQKAVDGLTVTRVLCRGPLPIERLVGEALRADLTKRSRMFDVSFDALAERGYRQFAFIGPGEQVGGYDSHFTTLLYKLSDGNFVSYKLVVGDEGLKRARLAWLAGRSLGVGSMLRGLRRWWARGRQPYVRPEPFDVLVRAIQRTGNDAVGVTPAEYALGVLSLSAERGRPITVREGSVEELSAEAEKLIHRFGRAGMGLTAHVVFKQLTHEGDAQRRVAGRPDAVLEFAGREVQRVDKSAPDDGFSEWFTRFMLRDVDAGESVAAEVTNSIEREQLEAEEARRGTENDAGEVSFYFVRREHVVRASRPPPRFQDLRRQHPGAIERLALSKEAICMHKATETAPARYANILCVSHRWDAPRQPDESGIQFEIIKAYVEEHPAVKYVWYDAEPHTQSTDPSAFSAQCTTQTAALGLRAGTTTGASRNRQTARRWSSSSSM